MIFDDSHPHEVWNDCDSQRIVLFVDAGAPAAFPAFDTQSSDHLDHSSITERRRTMDRIRQLPAPLEAGGARR